MGRMYSLAKVLAASLVAAACGRIGFVDEGPYAKLAPAIELDAECGVMPATSGALTITNDGTEDLEIVNAQATGGFVVVTPLPLVIPPGDSASLAIAPPLAVIGTDRAGDRRTGRLTLETNEVTPTRIVTLGATVIGAELAVTGPGGAPLALDLMGTGGACPAPGTMLVSNAGNRAVQITVSGSATLAPSGPSSGVVEANSSLSFNVKGIATGSCSGMGDVQIATTGPTCVAPTALAGSFVITGATSCFCS